MSSKYVVNYQVTDPDGKVLGSGSTKADYTGDSDPNTKESKESLGTKILYSLEVQVTNVKPAN